jgi:site-specific recombinase XerD
MLQEILSSHWHLQQARLGLFGDYIDGLASHLLAQGYRHDYTRQKLHLIVAFGSWLQTHRYSLTALDEAKVDSFLRARRRRRTILRGDRMILCWWLEHLRSEGHIPPRPKPTPSALDRAIASYTDYLQQERGLARLTVRQYSFCVRRFLSECFGRCPLRLDRLRQSDTNRHFQRQSAALNPNTMQSLAASLRSYFTFLRMRGDIQIDLASSVPAVACWRLSTVPRFIQPDEVQRLLAGCDQNTVKGQRDYTILLLLARLGLRAGEVVAMQLDDLHWETGEMLVRGKGQLLDHLPIPTDVGKALAKYLRHGRPRCSSRHVFVRLNAPHREFGGAYVISTIVQQTMDRIGLHPPCKGAHVLRHSLATHMLHRGASLAEIGEVLRHRAPTTTEHYSKVAFDVLRALAQPWPKEAL